MLDLTVESLTSEYEAAIEKTRQALAAYKDQLEKRAGPFFTGNGSPGAARRNYYHRWMSYVVSKMVGGKPRVRVGAMMESEAGEDLELQLMANRWLVDKKLKPFLRDGPATDMQYNWGVVQVAPEPVAGARPIEGVGTDWMPGDPHQGAPEPRVPWAPTPYRIPQQRYFEDALAVQRDEIRLQGHLWVRDRNAIMREGEAGGWDIAAVEAYLSDIDSDLIGRVTDGKVHGVQRDEIVGCDIWVPEYDLEEGNPWGARASPGREKGFHGTIFTLLVNRLSITYADSGATGILGPDGKPIRMADLRRPKQGMGFPRKPRPWYGPPEGPYVVFGQFGVAGHTLPLGALTACEQEIRELDTDVRISQRRMRTYKRLVILARGGEDEIEIVRDAEDEGIVRVSGITKDDVHPVEYGGLSEQAVQHQMYSEQNLEGSLGLSEMHSGQVSGVGLATEQQIANNAAQTRFAGLKESFDEGSSEVVRRACWFLYNDNRVARDLGAEDSQELVQRGYLKMDQRENADGSVEERLPRATYLGGQRNGQESRLPWNSLTIETEIEERSSPEVEIPRAQAITGLVMQLVQGAANFPSFPWSRLAARIEGAIGVPGLSDMFGKPDEIAQAAIAVQQAINGSTEQTGSSNGPPQQSSGGRPSVRAGKPNQSTATGPAGARSSPRLKQKAS